MTPLSGQLSPAIVHHGACSTFHESRSTTVAESKHHIFDSHIVCQRVACDALKRTFDVPDFFNLVAFDDNVLQHIIV